jgi:uncharacterized protein
MELPVAALLFGAGIVGGIMSAIAGGASLITFPAMLAAGLPPIVANASNSIAGAPSSFVAALSNTSSLPAMDRNFLVALAVSLTGSALGCWLLLVTSERLFTQLVPVLIGFATCVFALGQRAKFCLGEGQAGAAMGRAVLMVPAAIYGGYFGAGLGVILLALFSATGREDIRAANALKNLLATAVSLVALVIFAQQSVVHWPATLTMAAGSIIGGAIGGRLIAVLPHMAVRAAAICAGIAMTVIYAWRYWV